MKSPKLRVQPSMGPKHFTGSDGYEHQFTVPCFACGGEIREGQPISYLRGGWAHAECASSAMAERGRTYAWLALGSDLAKYPKSFGTVETRVIVNQLLRLAAGMQPDEYEPDEEG